MDDDGIEMRVRCFVSHAAKTETVCWRVRVYWRDPGGSLSLWETGGDVAFPAGTTWSEAVAEVLRMRGAGGHDLHRVEVERLDP